MSLGVLLALSMASSVVDGGAAPDVAAPGAPPSASPPATSVVTPPTAPPPSASPPATSVVTPSTAPPPTAAPPSVVTPPSASPPSDEPAGEAGDATTDEAAAPAQPEPASAPAVQPAVDPGAVDYSDTWSAAPPSTVVITTVVHRPVRRPPPPAPELEYEPRAHGFLGLSLRGTTTTNHNPSVLSGGRLGFVFDDRFTIGGAFYSLTARFGGPIVDPVGNKLGMRMAYGGVLLGWTLYKGRVVQLGLETLAGAGAACVSKNRRSHGKWQCLEKVGLVTIEPGLSLGFTVTDWVRVGLTGGYRFVTREAWRTPNDFTMSGPYVGLDIDFGAFRKD